MEVSLSVAFQTSPALGVFRTAQHRLGMALLPASASLHEVLTGSRGSTVRNQVRHGGAGRSSLTELVFNVERVLPK
jgi:hypothetical protein